MAAAASPSKVPRASRDGEFAPPPAPEFAPSRSRSRNKLNDGGRKKVERMAPPRTSLEDTIENLVELPLSSELMSSRARGSNKHANPLKASTSRTSLSSLKNHPEPLGPATPGLEAYRRPGSSGSETSALFDYYNADPSEPFAPSPTVTNGPYMPRRPSASSTSSNNSSRIPVATPSLSKSWSASDSHNARSFRPDPNYAFPRSISQGSSLPTDENKQVSSPARRKASMRKRDPSKAGKPPEKHQDQIERPDTASSIPLRNNSPPSPHTPLQPSGTSAGTSRSAPAKKPGAQSKETPLGERRIPTTGQRATKGQVSSAPHTRTRAVTGNAGTKRPSQVVTKTPKGRTRAMSAIGRDTSANSEDLLAADDSRDDSPFVRDTSPIVYRSDQISKSKTSDSLTALARGDEKVAGLDEARTWDDVVIPTVAKQLHQQELLEQAIAADEAEQARKAKEARDVRDRDYLAAFEQNKKQDESTTSPSSQEKTTAPAEGHLERGRKASPAVTPLRDVSTTNRKEAWEMPEFASPTTMKQTLNNQGRAQNLPKYPQESEDTDKGGCCTGCVVS